ncbi:MAG: putative phosphatase [Acidimicrobiaceae bacterium]|nr:putative phosphatase [Acidimicrobiaceae bacterium]
MDDDCWLLDLDGVVWLADEPIPGGAEAVSLLRSSGRRVVFFTNNSYAPHASQVDKLRRFGLEAEPDDLLGSAQAAASCCQPGERALVLGGPGILEALTERGVHTEQITDDLEPLGAHAPSADVVVAGIDLALTYRRLSVATTVVRRGARLVATNDDATFPSPEGIVPGAGSILAALRTATGVEGIIAGKPYQPAAALVRERLGRVTTVVGDRPSTDGLLAERLGARFALVLSGVTPPDHGKLEAEPDLEAPDLLSLVRAVVGGDA